MQLREAHVDDIPDLHRIRVAVRENRLSDPGRITPADYMEFLFERGRGWVTLAGEVITGFAIVDLSANNVWALFVDPLFERQGFGLALHDQMLDWYFRQTKATLWLGTSPGTRAESFYEACGWNRIGLQPDGELRFEMSYDQWNAPEA